MCTSDNPVITIHNDINNKNFLLFLRGYSLGIVFFRIALWFTSSGILIFGYRSMKISAEFWKSLFPEWNTQH